MPPSESLYDLCSGLSASWEAQSLWGKGPAFSDA
jgi:hypothetical protein